MYPQLIGEELSIRSLQRVHLSSPVVDIDFSVPANIGSLSFPEGSMDGDTLCINATIIDDINFEKNHTFNVTIDSTEDNVDIGPVALTTVTIIDDEG